MMFLTVFIFVFRQLREQSKKLVGVKRNQQLEREKQAELLNEVKKQEDQKDETTEYFQVTSEAYSAGPMASWLVLNWTTRVQALAGDKCIVLCSWARHFTLTVPLSTQVYKCVPANLMLGVTLRWAIIRSRGE